MRKLLIAFMMSLLLFPAAWTEASWAQTTGSISRGPSGLPLPRFVSLKAERVNMRVGPGKQYAVAYRYMRSGLPLEIIQEYDNWRRVRDSEGDTGWIHGSLLSGTRTAIATPWRNADDADDVITLYREQRAGADPVAMLQPGVVGRIEACDGAWCELEVRHGDRTLSGFVAQADLWGAYPDEVIE
ncbi:MULTISPECIES: SH3 domain-containing protein [unclassified Roseitalea]|uniref:SH3 domain-containing protein n=1 Tax=unclassified Roseitalea TaxID=2639107 RepID=UPI00273E7CD1|nr:MULTISPECIES: SH3 domain-containing protein [unclassified Roseitalea]